MDEVLLTNLLVVILCVFTLFWLFFERNKLNETADELFDAMEIMEKSISTVAIVLQKLPEMVPQFQINQNPLSQLLEFFQGMNKQDGSLTEPLLRDDVGRFSNAEEREEEIK
jgi:hypothetical protein